MDNSILYEFPCNEKTRMYLRLEMLFRRFNWLMDSGDPVAHNAALSVLFELTDATSRSDLKSELIQALDKVKTGAPQALSPEKAQEVSLQAQELSHEISSTHGRFGQNIRENEWLQLIRARQNIPGGTGAFDMPLLHYWLNLAPENRKIDLANWSSTLTPICKSVKLILALMRQNCEIKNYLAPKARLQLQTTGNTYHIARIWVNRELALIPEVSVNKYMLWIRFSEADSRNRLHASNKDVSFSMGLCQH